MNVMDDMASLGSRLAQWMMLLPSAKRSASGPVVTCPRCRQRMQRIETRTEQRPAPGLPMRRSTWCCYTCFAEPTIDTWH